MAAKCEIQFPNGDLVPEAELDFIVSNTARPQIIYNNQIGFLENPKGTQVFHEKGCKSLWFTIRRTR